MNEIRTVAIVLHFRSPQMTLACLESLLDSGLRHAVLVDNSQDGGASLRIMSDGLEALMHSGLRVDVEEPGRNLGFAAGVNLGIRRTLAEGEARVLLLNSDARLTARALEAMQAVISGGSAMVAPIVGRAINDVTFPHGYHRWLAVQAPAWVPGCISYLSGACLLISEATVHPQLLDEDFFFYWEDVELSDRLMRQGARITLLNDHFVEHHASGSSKNGSWFYEYSIVRGHWLLARKLTRGSMAFTVALSCRAPVLMSRALVRAIRARNLRPIHALFVATSDLLRGITRDVTPPADVTTTTEAR